MEPTLGLLGVNGSSGLSSNESKVEALGQEHVGMATPNPEDTELELGLSLGGGVKVKPYAGAWGECGRILTAKDFPSVPSHGSSAPPRFSSAAVSGTKRPADSSPQQGGSPPRSSQVVGWPPIRAYRMNSLVNQAKNSKDEEEDKAIDGKERSKDALKNIHNEQNNNTITLKARRHSGFVKVNMDGIPIGRKVDLNAHACYGTLAQTLEDMFFNPATTSLLAIESKEIQMKLSKLLDGSSEFVLTYEDKEGDWMLVGDVPWRMFVSTVKRLRIMKTSEANGLAPTDEDKSEKQRIKPI